jgi:uncharacterized heparinase superfamily protein
MSLISGSHLSTTVAKTELCPACALTLPPIDNLTPGRRAAMAAHGHLAEIIATTNVERNRPASVLIYEHAMRARKNEAIYVARDCMETARLLVNHDVGMEVVGDVIEAAEAALREVMTYRRGKRYGA